MKDRPERYLGKEHLKKECMSINSLGLCGVLGSSFADMVEMEVCWPWG